MSSDSVVDMIAEMEHIHFQIFIKKVLASEPNLSSNLKTKWEQIANTPYAQLPPEQKKAGKDWAKLVVCVAQSQSAQERIFALMGLN